MAKQKDIYQVWHGTTFGMGLQYVKADTETEAKHKFKKRFPKWKIGKAEKVDEPTTQQRQYAI